jgi:hypothetical protein
VLAVELALAFAFALKVDAVMAFELLVLLKLVPLEEVEFAMFDALKEVSAVDEVEEPALDNELDQALSR